MKSKEVPPGKEHGAVLEEPEVPCAGQPQVSLVGRCWEEWAGLALSKGFWVWSSHSWVTTQHCSSSVPACITRAGNRLVEHEENRASVLSCSPQEEAAGWEKKAHKAVLAAACWLRDACFASKGKAELFVPLFCS